MEDLVYSINEEEFNDDFDSAADSAFDYEGVKVGDVRTIFSGVPNRFQASDFFPRIDWIIESAQENAHGEVGEFSDDFLAAQTREAEEELAASLKEAFQKWADNHGLDPTFYGIKNVKEVKVRIVNFDGEYEEVADQAS